MNDKWTFIEYRKGMQLDSDELAELAELDTPPKPDYFDTHDKAPLWPGLLILAAIALVSYLALRGV